MSKRKTKHKLNRMMYYKKKSLIKYFRIVKNYKANQFLESSKKDYIEDAEIKNYISDQEYRTLKVAVVGYYMD